MILIELPKNLAVDITMISNDNKKKKAVIIFDKRQLKSNQRRNLKIDKRTIAPLKNWKIEKLLHFGLKSLPPYNDLFNFEVMHSHSRTTLSTWRITKDGFGPLYWNSMPSFYPVLKKESHKQMSKNILQKRQSTDTIQFLDRKNQEKANNRSSYCCVAIKNIF